MSAYLVSKETIDCLVLAAVTYPSHGSAFRWVARSLKSSPVEGEHVVGRRVVGQLDADLEGRNRRAGEQELPGGTISPADLGQLLWDWNVRSLRYRYPDAGPRCAEITQHGTECGIPRAFGCAHGAPNATWGAEIYAPPVKDGPLSLSAGLTPTWEAPDPVDVLGCARCLRYQACEHPTWDLEEAFFILQAIEEEAARRLSPDAPWGLDAREEVTS